MKRRQFVTLLASAATAWPLAAHAQQAGKLPTIGFLGSSSASGWSPWTAALVQRLQQLGWVEGHRCDRVSLGGWTQRALC
jgi:putative tryptophan/tyrosine transport system substrate-binding protein